MRNIHPSPRCRPASSAPKLTPTLSALALALLTACSSLPQDNAQLGEARLAYSLAQADSQTRTLAAPELKVAADALAQAETAWTREDEADEVSHLAYLAKRRIAIAGQVGQRRAAEQVVAEGQAQRDQLRLQARTRELSDAQAQTQLAQARAGASAQQAQDAQSRADDAQVRNYQLETQLRALDARQTERGLLITLSDVLFDSSRAQLRPPGRQRMEQLAAFLREHPQRRVLVEGYTDSVGSDSSNSALSLRRAEAVRNSLLEQGIALDRVSSRGHGESFPVAGNDSASGRQMNRRVEILLSDLNGLLPQR